MKKIVLALILLAHLTGSCGSSETASGTQQPTQAMATESPELRQSVSRVPATPSTEPTRTVTPAPTSNGSQPFDASWDDRAIFRGGLITAEERVLERLPGASVYHIDFRISEDLLQLKGQERVHYTNQENEPLEEILFRLFPNAFGGRAVPLAIRIDGEDIEPVFGLGDSAIRTPLPSPLPPGQSLDIEIDFEVQVAQTMEAGYGLFGYFDGVLALDEFYPVIPVYDDEGWNAEETPDYGDATYLDASFYLVRVSAPAGLTIVASGVEVARELEGDTQFLTFAAGPARDFYLAASENYTVASERLGETTVNSYAFAERGETAQLALRFAVGALRSFSERFGVYPYTEFDILSTHMRALGMEYPGVVGLASELYDPGTEVLGMPSEVVLESTTAHEVAHQWFYNVVGNDQIDEPWLDEAVVQYATGLYYLDTYGQAAAESYRASWDSRWARVDRAELPIGLPVAAYDGNEYGAIVYGRGPIFMTALAEEMGQGTFDKFLRDYYESHKWGIGTSEAFRQLAERHCQCDLSALFDQWVCEDAP